MKKIFRYTLLIAASMSLCACVQNLDTMPLNETDYTEDNAYDAGESAYLAGLAEIASYYSCVSINDPGSSDLSVKDAGQSELLRQYINLNELSADSFKCVWTGDSYVAELQSDSWTATENAATVAVYTRCMKGITLVNEYLRQTEADKLEARGHGNLQSKIAGYRAEARFHRALFYYLLMDLYGNPPFATADNITGEMPKQIGRAALYEWIEKECLDLLSGSDMPAKGEVVYPRPTKGSVQALLARMYLNAEVYTGTAQWQKAKDAAKAVIGMGYTLHSNYAELFMQDNTETGAAAEEFIFGIEYDKDHAQSWGGTTTLSSAALSTGANTNLASLVGVTNGSMIMPESWDGYHVAPDYVDRFELKGVNWDKTGFGYNRETSDKRAFFYNEGEPEFDVMTAKTGWRCWKFSGLYSDGRVVDQSLDTYKFSSCDFPFFRLAEMYLIYAEADARLNGGKVTDSEAMGYIKALRDRAGVATPEQIDLDWLLDERARELMWEGHRRTDLIRYGYFTSASFPWAGKGGVANGKVAIPSYRTIYPILMTDINANTNLKQNPGY